MPLAPIPLAAREVRLLLLEMARLAGDRHSFDGSLEYHAWGGPPCTQCQADPEDDEAAPCSRCEGTGDEPLPEGADYWVHGVLRDNSDGGQGFMKIIGTMLDSKGQPLAGLEAL